MTQKKVFMSLIACTDCAHAPFVIGDLLFSSQTRTKDFISPTHVPMEQVLANTSSKWHPAELYQKLYIIKENVCVALAGIETEMRSFLKELKLRCNFYQWVTSDHIHTFLNDFDLPANYANSAMLLLVLEQSGGRYINGGQFTAGQWTGIQHDDFGTVIAWGSGSSQFLHQLTQPVTFEASAQKGFIERNISANMNLIAKWLSIENITGTTVKERWGCGYEAIFFNGTAFEKFERVAYVTCRGIFDPDDELVTMPAVVNFYHYYKDVLFILSLRIFNPKHSKERHLIHFESSEIAEDLFVVPSIDLPPGSSIELPPDVSFKANKVAIGYDIRKDDTDFFNSSLFVDGFETVLEYDHAKRLLRLSLTSELNEKIKAGAQAYFDQPAE